MLKSSRRAFQMPSTSLKKLELPKELLKEKGPELQKPEERFTQEAESNHYYRGLITLSLGKGFSQRHSIAKKDIERFTLLYQTDSKSVKEKTYCGIVPLQRKGFPWESKESKKVRRVYRKRADKMFERLEVCEFDGQHFDSGCIELADIPYKTVDYLEFSSAAALVDKKPHKRRNHNSGDSVYFKDFYIDGKRGMLFGVFDAFSEKTKTDHKLSMMLVSFFKNFFNSVSFVTDETKIFSMLSSFLNYAEETIPFTGSSGASMSIGIVYNGNLYYLNIGDCRIYSISFYPNTKVKKLTIDDGMSGLIERGAKVSKKEFFSQLKVPEYYLGCFGQVVSGKRRLHKKITPVHPNIGKIPLKNSEFLLVSTDGFWSNLPININKGFVSDASGESTISSILSQNTQKNAKQILERLYDYSKANMKMRANSTYKNSFLKPAPQDMGLLGFSV